jgi:hypothetical protein
MLMLNQFLVFPVPKKKGRKKGSLGSNTLNKLRMKAIAYFSEVEGDKDLKEESNHKKRGPSRCTNALKPFFVFDVLCFFVLYCLSVR